MQEINRVPDVVRIPVPVGEGREKHRRQKSNQDEFSDILEREKDEGGTDESQWQGERDGDGSDQETIPAAEKGPDRGLLIDERA